MPMRRRCATRDELTQMLAVRNPERYRGHTDLIRVLLDDLAAFGVPVESFVKIEVGEPTPGAGAG